MKIQFDANCLQFTEIQSHIVIYYYSITLSTLPHRHFTQQEIHFQLTVTSIQSIWSSGYMIVHQDNIDDDHFKREARVSETGAVIH